MKIIKTNLPDLVVIEPAVYEDERGYFYESYNKEVFKKNGFDFCFVQDNQSKSSKNVLRGLHYQLAPHAQTKLVRVLSGEIFDVAADIRKGSPTFGKWFGIRLSSDNKRQLLVPRGFAHGFSVLSETAVVLYKCDNLYKRDAERGINYNDPALIIDWQISLNEAIISDRDRVFPMLNDAEHNFIYEEI
ncbi:MAG: dTDP-4-dehydrorhamnose 3,5-epimerase [Bacteroidota bacterium]